MKKNNQTNKNKLIMKAGLAISGMAFIASLSFFSAANVSAEEAFSEGSLVRDASSKIYVIRNKMLTHIRSITELRNNYFSKRITNVSDDAIQSFFVRSKNGSTMKVNDNIFVNNLPMQNLIGTSSPATAIASINSFSRKGLYDVMINIKIRDLAQKTGKVYEAWLTDTDTGYNLSLGGLVTNNAGNGEFDFDQAMVNFPIYDKLIITEESENDVNPNPNASIFTADIPAIFKETNMRASLSGVNEVPPTDTTASGSGKFVINTKDNTLSFDIKYQGLRGEETSAHIHGPADVGQNADILFALPAGEKKTGTWNYDQSLENDILSGRTYVNVHSTVFPEGEIRGQILR